MNFKKLLKRSLLTLFCALIFMQTTLKPQKEELVMPMDSVVQIVAYKNLVNPITPFKSSTGVYYGSGFIIKLNPEFTAAIKEQFIIATNLHICDSGVDFEIYILSSVREAYKAKTFVIILGGSDICLLRFTPEALEKVKRNNEGECPYIILDELEELTEPSATQLKTIIARSMISMKRDKKIITLGYHLRKRSLKINRGNIAVYTRVNLYNSPDLLGTESEFFIEHSSPTSRGNSGRPVLDANNFKVTRCKQF